MPKQNSIWSAISSPRRTPFLVFAAAALLLLLMEMSFATFEPFWDRLGPPSEIKLAQYRAFLKDPGRYDSVVIGSSLPYMGIDPALVDPSTGHHFFNGGQFNYTALNLTHAAATEIIAKKKVRTLVVCIDGWAGGAGFLDRDHVDSHLQPADLRWHSTVFRGRDVFVFWVKRLAQGKFSWPQQAWRDHVVSSGRFAEYGSVTTHPNGYLAFDALIDPNWPAYLRPQLLDQERIKLIGDILDQGKTAGVQVVLLRMPEYVRTYLESPDLHRQVSAQLDAIAAAHGVKLIDFSLPGSFAHADLSLFADMHHLNATGAPIFSRLLGKRLAELAR